MKTPIPRTTALGFNMTPMIDVVFLLIIFFLVASHFSRQEQMVEVDLPQAESGVSIREEEKTYLTLSVLSTGTLFLGSREMELENLTTILTAEKERTGGNFQLRIRADRQTLYRTLQPILQAAAEAGIFNIQFAVIP
ncbi:MAG: biopolymer transporter ExbD [Planctomycetia bacterium]|nr:biopolymer transporter ExbD [Planctomycetia bacterium]